MATVSYITPITDRTWDDVEYAKIHQNDLVNKNKGAWNYTDCNRVCNNLKYAAEWMYDQGFLSQPYTMQIKLDWSENDIITIEQLNTMIVNNMNNLYSYSRDDLEWYPISSITNMNYSLANWLEKNIHQLATQIPPPPDTFKLTVENGSGSGNYEAETVVNIIAHTPELGMVFDHWSGDHLENIGDASAANTTYTMPNQNINLKANYSSTVPHTATVITYTGTTQYSLYMGSEIHIEADPAPQGKVFHHWNITPSQYEKNLYEPAATTTFTMPNEDVTLEAVYITTGDKQLIVTNGTGSGLYKYGIYVQISPSLPTNAVFTQWTGDTQYLTGPATQAYNSIQIPDVNIIRITANWTIPPTPPVTNVELEVINGTITNTGETIGLYTQGDYVGITANDPLANQVFTGWTKTGGGSISNSSSKNATITIGTTKTTVTANYRTLEYFDLTVITNAGTTTTSVEKQSTFSINAGTPPSGYIFDHWEGDVSGLSVYKSTTSATMGSANRTITAIYRPLEYHQLTVITNSGTTTQQKERDDYFSVNANPAQSGYVFDYWSGDITSYRPPKISTYPSSNYTFDTKSVSTGTYMNTSDRTITAVYRPINPHTVTVKQPSGDVTYTQAEFSTVSITAETQSGKRFTGWSLSGYGSLSTYSGQTTVYTFGNGDATLTPNYINRWNIDVVDGTINGSASGIFDQGSQYSLNCRSLAVYEKFNGWTVSGPGTIRNTASTSTYFTVGEGDATITANIEQYPDKTLTIYLQDPDTEEITLVSRETYRYGTKITNIEAPVAPNQTTFLTWIGGDQDINMLSPSALASTVTINSLTRDVTITATYFYPEAPEYYTLSVFNGYPRNQNVQVGTQVAIRANTPDQGYEFYKWFGDTAYLVDKSEEGLKSPDNSIIMPKKSITLYAKFKVIGELPLFRVSVENGIASGSYETGEGTEEDPTVVHNEEGVYIDIPAGTEVTLTADADLVGWVFDYWDGNFESAGVIDIVTTNNPTVFTMVENNINVTMVRRELDTYTVYTTNATGPGTTYPGKYSIAGSLIDTDDIHYTFVEWECIDANETDCISAIEESDKLSTYITLTDKDLWITAKYTAHYKLTVVNGQDTGDHYYYEGEVVNSITADTPMPGSQLIFDHWEDPVGIITTNIYDPTPIVEMGDTPATITAVYTSSDAQGNSVVLAGNDLHTDRILRSTSTLINGLYTVGTLVFDRDGCIGLITQVDPDNNDDTDDFQTEKFFYGGNV